MWLLRNIILGPWAWKDGGGSPRDGIKLALTGFRHLVDLRDLPTHLEWALAPYRSALASKLSPWQHAWPFGVCVGLGAGIKELFPWVQASNSSLVDKPTLGLLVVLWCH